MSEPIAPPELFRRVAIPRAYTTTETVEGERLRYGGDVRVGDLDGDGRAELLVYRAVDGVKPSYLAAFTLDGDPLWEQGEGGDQPARPGPVVAYDVDGDGADEVVCLFHDGSTDDVEGDSTDDAGGGSTDHDATDETGLADVVMQIRDGATGQVVRERHPPIFDEITGSGGNWVHQRLLVANFRGTDRPRDFLIELGGAVLAFDDDLAVQWEYAVPDRWSEYPEHTAYFPAVGDVDDDGRDEVTAGKYLLDHDGSVRWERDLARHTDSVAIDTWNGEPRVFVSGFGHVVDADGEVDLALGEDVAPHGQEIRVANFLADREGNEFLLRHRGHEPAVLLVGGDGEVLADFELNDTPNETGMTPVYWHGPDEPAIVCNGGALWTADGRHRVDLPDLPEPVGPAIQDWSGYRMGWYHCIPANVCGDDREEVVVYDPWDEYVYVYTPAPLDEDAFAGYESTPRQYNARIMD